MQRQVHKNVATCRTTNTGLRWHGGSLASCVNAAGSFNKCSWQLHSFGPILGAVSVIPATVFVVLQWPLPLWFENDSSPNSILAKAVEGE